MSGALEDATNKEIVKKIIDLCGKPESAPLKLPNISLLRMDCLSKQLIRVSEDFGSTDKSLEVIAVLQLLKIRLRKYICIADSDENLIALKNKLKEEYMDSRHQFNNYFYENIGECKRCWDRNTEKHGLVKAYLATILLIHAADVLLNQPDIGLEVMEPLFPKIFK